MVRGIRPLVAGVTIRTVRACMCRCRPMTIVPSLPRIARRTEGRQIVEVRRLAKRVVLQLDDGAAFVIEPRMTGLMLVADPPDREHLRVEWELTRGRRTQRLWFWDRRGLGTLRLLEARELADLEHGGRLGPDPIGLSLGDWSERLRRLRRVLKVALLDQRVVAGIGNLYASEILHVAGLHPLQRTDRLTRSEIDRLRAATDVVLKDAIAHEGSTLSDGTYRNVLNQDGGYQNAHRVYDRAEEDCPTCRAAQIVRIVQAQRSTFYCPNCQRRGRRQGSAARKARS